jgi:thioredoxin reductase
LRFVECNHLGRVTEVAIIGAGPYGLSIAAHLRKLGIGFRLFGRPMHTWLTQMPKGMLLKSEGFASNLSDPDDQLTLDRFCIEQRIPHRSDLYESGWAPVPVETFTAYGLSFQARFVPEYEERTVVALQRSPDCFILRLDEGEPVHARNVVVAVGIHYFQHLPAELSHLPTKFLSHSSDHHDLDRFSGRKVAVIGAGASASELAALLHENGADVHLVTRRHSLDFQPVPTPRAFWRRALRPLSAIGYGWHSFLTSEAPSLICSLPLEMRVWLVQRYLRPCAGWFVKDRVMGQIPLLLGTTQLRANIQNGRVHLQIVADNGAQHELAIDHVIAATGYVPDLRRLTFLSEDLRSQVRSAEQAPILSLNFQSSVPGLYFVGPLSSNSFGPVMRFVHGARFTARRVSGHLARTLAGGPVGQHLLEPHGIEGTSDQATN